MDIHRQQIIQQKILEKIPPVQALLICIDQILQLADSHFCNHQSIVTGSGSREDIDRLSVIQDLEQIAHSDDLAVHRHACKTGDNGGLRHFRLRSCRNDISLQVLHAELCPGDLAKFLQAGFYYLRCNHIVFNPVLIYDPHAIAAHASCCQAGFLYCACFPR